MKREKIFIFLLSTAFSNVIFAQKYKSLEQLQQERKEKIVQCIEFFNIAVGYKDYKEANKWAESAIKVDSNSFMGYALKSNLFYKQNDWANAYNYAYISFSIAKNDVGIAANSTQTPRYASGQALICLNTCGLLKRASLERKKSAGGRTCLLLRVLH